jgi:hypothetical protein
MLIKSTKNKVHNSHICQRIINHGFHWNSHQNPKSISKSTKWIKRTGYLMLETIQATQVKKSQHTQLTSQKLYSLQNTILQSPRQHLLQLILQPHCSTFSPSCAPQGKTASHLSPFLQYLEFTNLAWQHAVHACNHTYKGLFYIFLYSINMYL